MSVRRVLRWLAVTDDAGAILIKGNWDAQTGVA